MKKLSPCDKCTTLALTDLEQRLVPAVWPFGNTDSPQFDQFLETWGQYQEIPTTNPDGSKLDQSVHYHEGMDIFRQKYNGSGAFCPQKRKERKNILSAVCIALSLLLFFSVCRAP